MQYCFRGLFLIIYLTSAEFKSNQINRLPTSEEQVAYEPVDADFFNQLPILEVEMKKKKSGWDELIELIKEDTSIKTEIMGINKLIVTNSDVVLKFITNVKEYFSIISLYGVAYPLEPVCLNCISRNVESELSPILEIINRIFIINDSENINSRNNSGTMRAAIFELARSKFIYNIKEDLLLTAKGLDGFLRIETALLACIDGLDSF